MYPQPVAGLAVGTVGVGVVVAVLAPFSADVGRATPALVLVLPILVAAALGGRRPALVVAALATVMFNIGFLPPTWSVRIHLGEDTAAFLVFGAVAATVGTFVAHEGARRQLAVRRATELAGLNRRLEVALEERDRFEHEARRTAVLEQVDQHRRALLRAVSHDLRTPLGTIVTVTDDLRHGVGFDTRTRDRLLELAGREAHRLDRIVGNLLSLSRIEAGAFAPDLAPVELVDLVDRATDRLDSILASFDVAVDVPEDLPAVLADSSQLDQTLTNLLENAAHHAPAGSTITISACAADDRVEAVVADHGAGVPWPDRDAVFEPFRSGRGGTGIGLAICRAVITAHGGTIWVDETPGGGTSVHFTLTVAG
jgi:K+-sensing histidine kinase KdpD